MALFWLLQILPLAVTGLIPFILFPMLEIMSTVDVAAQYYKEFVITFMAGFVLATALEDSGLHKRFALRILKLTGSKQHLILLGLMVPTFLISMWITNLAVCVLMVAIADEMVKQLEEQAKEILNKNDKTNIKKNGELVLNKLKHSPHMYDNPAISLVSIHNIDDVEVQLREYKSLSNNNIIITSFSGDPDLSNNLKENTDLNVETVVYDLDKNVDPSQIKAMDSWFKNIKACYSLGIAYTSVLGGSSVLSGAPANLLAKDVADGIWQEHGYVSSPINFTSWLVINLPVSGIVFFVLWGWFCLHFLGWGACSLEPGARKFANIESEKIDEYLQREIRKLGNWRYKEYVVAVMLACTILLWFFLEPDFMPGWGSGFQPGFVTMAVPGAMIFALFILIPDECTCVRKSKGMNTITTIGSFSSFVKKFPWAIPLMVGGGNAMSQAMRVTGLTSWMADGLIAGLSSFPPVALMLTLSLMVTFLTEVVANAVPINIFVPIASQVAESMGKNPLYLIFPVALASTYSFVLPMAGAVNAWILTSGYATVKDSVKAGILVNIICVLVTILGMHTWGAAYLDLDTVPWANSTNNNDNTTASILTLLM